MGPFVSRRSRFNRAARAVALLLPLLLSACTTLKKCEYEGFFRDRWQMPREVVRVLELRPEEAVADLGSGSGYFVWHLAAAVGPEGIVFAVDIDTSLNRYITREARTRGLGNVLTVDAPADSFPLQTESVDLIFTSNTYHHLPHRSNYFRKARRALRPGGRVAILDYNGRHWLNRLIGHRSEKTSVVREMEEAGYRLEASHTIIDRQLFLVFRPTAVN